MSVDRAVGGFWIAIIQAIWAGLTDVATMMRDPSERIYWPFLLSAALIGLVVVRARHSERRRPVELRLALASAWLDGRLLVVNAVVRALVALASTGSAYALAVSVVGWGDRWLGPVRVTAVPPAGIALIYTVVLYVAWDASRYWLHRWMHEIPWLWEFHQVHHSAQVLSPLSLYRVHPVESLLYAVRGVVVTGTVTALFFYLFRARAVEYELLGINAIGFVFNLLGGNLRHSHVWWSWGRLERWLISPAQHQLHHSRDLPRSANLGTGLAIWDRWAGTLVYADAGPPTHFGLAPRESNHDGLRLTSALLGPVRAAIAVARHSSGLRRRSFGWLGSVVVLVSLWVASGRAGAAQPATDSTGSDRPRPEASPRKRQRTESPKAARGKSRRRARTPAAQPAQDQNESAGAAADGSMQRSVVVGAMFNQAELPRVAGSAHVLSERDLDKHEYDDMHRILGAVPGVYVRGEDGFGLRPNIGLRGANPDRSAKITLLEDGILMAPAPYAAPAAYYFPLPTRMVGVEVFKGPSSIRNGPNTIGGAINLLTRPIPRDHEVMIDVAGGRFGYAKGHGFYGTTYKGFGVLLEAAHLQTTGFKRLDTDDDTGFHKTDGMLKLGYESPHGGLDTHRVELKLGLASELSHETYLGIAQVDFDHTPYRRYAASARDRMSWWRSQAELTYAYAGTEIEVEARAYRHDFHRVWRRLDRFREGPSLTSILAHPDSGQTAVLAAILRGEEDSDSPEQALLVTNNDRRFVSQGVQALFRWRPRWQHAEQDLEFGLRVHQDSITRNHLENAYLMRSGRMVAEDSPSFYAVRNRGSAAAVAFHVHETLTLWDRVTIAPGMRVELISMGFADRLADEGASRFDVAATPGIGALVKATSWLGVFAGVHRGFSPVAPGQPKSVKPESSINYETGLRVTRRGLWAEAVGFFSDYNNLNGVCTFSSGCTEGDGSKVFNAGRVWVYGLESLIRYRHRFRSGFGIEVGANYTYTGSQFRRGFSSEFGQWGDVVAGDELPYVPKHIVSGTFGLGGRWWDISATPGYTGAMRDVAGSGQIPADERIPGYFLLDLSAQARLMERVQVYAQVGNATNAAYAASRRPFGLRPGAPLTFMFGFKIHLAGPHW